MRARGALLVDVHCTSASAPMVSVQPEPPFFLFDGDCGFCNRWASWVQRRLPTGATFVAYQDVDDLNAYGLTADDVETASYWVDREGTPHRGARSFAHALRQGTGPWAILGAVLDAPVIGGIADRIYPVVGRNRHRLPAPESHDTG